jgi:predicted nucleic acid-binding protein
MAGEPCLVDSNVLIRWVQTEDSGFQLARKSIEFLEDHRQIPCYTSQNLGEFWNALTRPADKNGYGLSLRETLARTEEVEKRFHLLADSLAVHRQWRKLLIDHCVSGVQVHDARIAASMLVHGVERILTFNTRDFARFPGIKAIHPSELSKR